MNLEQQALKTEISDAIKKWSEQAHRLGVHLVISVSIKSKENEEVFNHMAFVRSDAQTLANHALAVANELPKSLRTAIFSDMLDVLTSDKESLMDDESEEIETESK